MLIITGLSRCGTSFLAQVLMAMNYKTGVGIEWNKESESGCELSTITSLNDDMYKQIIKHGRVNLKKICLNNYWGDGGYGYTYEQAIQNFDKDEKQGTVSFIKNPAFMWHPEILKSWWRVRKDLRFMILHRDFEDIVLSRNRLHGESQTIDPLKIRFADSIASMEDMRIPYRIEMFPKYLYDAKPLFRKIRELGLQTCHLEGNKLVQEMRDLDKVHFGRRD